MIRCIKCNNIDAFYGHSRRNISGEKYCWSCWCKQEGNKIEVKNSWVRAQLRHILRANNSGRQVGELVIMGLDGTWDDPFGKQVRYDGYTLKFNFDDCAMANAFCDYQQYHGVENPFRERDERVLLTMLKVTNLRLILEVLDKNTIRVPFMQPFGLLSLDFTDSLAVNRAGIDDLGYIIDTKTKVVAMTDSGIKCEITHKSCSIQVKRSWLPLYHFEELENMHREGKCSEKCTYGSDIRCDECEILNPTFNLDLVYLDANSKFDIGSLCALPKDVLWIILSDCSNSLPIVSKGFYVLSKFFLNFDLGPYFDNRFEKLVSKGFAFCGTDWDESIKRKKWARKSEELGIVINDEFSREAQIVGFQSWSSKLPAKVSNHLILLKKRKEVLYRRFSRLMFTTVRRRKWESGFCGRELEANSDGKMMLNVIKRTNWVNK